jgi:hypothetical protein
MGDRALYEAIMRCAIEKCIKEGEYYNETEDGNIGFEISEDGRIFLNHVSELATDLSRWLDTDINIMDLVKELDDQ